MYYRWKILDAFLILFLWAFWPHKSFSSETENTSEIIQVDRFKLAQDKDDDSPSIRRALDESEKRNIHRIFFSSKKYIIKTSIIIKTKNDFVCESPGLDPDNFSGTLFYIDNVDIYPVIIQGKYSRGESIIGCSWKEEQNPVQKSTWAPKPYKALITIRNTLGEVNIIDNYMIGISNGIKIRDSGRIKIDGLYGQFFYNAIDIDKSYDVDRISNIHQWPYWSNDKKVLSFQQKNLDVIRLGRVDGAAFGTGLFTYASNSFINLSSNPDKNSGGPSTKAQIPYLTCDFTRICIKVTGFGTTADIGVIDSQAQNVEKDTPLENSSALTISQNSSLEAGVSKINMQFSSGSIIDDQTTSGVNYLSIGSIRSDWSNTIYTKNYYVFSKNSNSIFALHDIPFGTNISPSVKTSISNNIANVSIPVFEKVR